jgi:hypothetical protein
MGTSFELRIARSMRDLGVDLSADQDDHAHQIQLYYQHNDRANASVGRAVARRKTQVEREKQRGDD